MSAHAPQLRATPCRGA